MYAPTECRSRVTKDKFYRDLFQLLRSARLTDFVVVANDFHAQHSYLAKMEWHIGCLFAVSTERADTGGRIL